MESKPQQIKGLASGAKTGLIGAIGGRFLNVLGNIIIARLFGPAIFGIYAIGWTLVRFFSLIIPLGMDRAVLWFAPKFWKRDSSNLKGIITKVHFIAIISGFLFGLGFYLLTPWMAISIYKKPELILVFRLFAFSFPLLSFLIVAAAATRITQKIKYSVWLYDLGQPLLSLILIITFYLLGQGVSGVILGEVLSLLCAAILGFFILRLVFPEILHSPIGSEISTSKIIKYSLPAMLGGAFSVYIIWFDRIFVGLFLPVYDNGIYMAVSQISTIFMVISSGLSPIAVPLFSYFYHRREFDKLEEVYRVSTKWGIYISIPILVVLLVSTKNSLAVMFGDKYIEGAPILLILLAGQVINLITGSVNPLLIMTENQNFLFKLSSIILILDLVMLVFLIPLFGLIGAAVSTSICISLLYLYELFWVKKRLNLWPFDKRYYKGIIAGLACFACVLFTRFLVPNKPVLGIIIQALIALTAFSGVLIIQKLESEDREFLLGLRRKI